MLKRTYSSTTQYGKSSKKAKPSPRRVPIYRSPRGITRLTRCARVSYALDQDLAAGFGFSATQLWRNGTALSGIDGASDMTNMFDLCRIVKVEIVALPACNMHELAYDSSLSGIRNLPYLYCAYDQTDCLDPNISSILQFDGLQITSFDKPYRRTFYPKLATASSGGIVLANTNWVSTGTDIPYCGIKLYLDNQANNVPYAGLMLNFIITYECKNPK